MLLPLGYERLAPRPLRCFECIHCKYQIPNVLRAGSFARVRPPPAVSTDAPPIRRECNANSSGLRPDCTTISLSARIAWPYPHTLTPLSLRYEAKEACSGSAGYGDNIIHHEGKGASGGAQTRTQTPHRGTCAHHDATCLLLITLLSSKAYPHVIGPVPPQYI